MTVTTDAGRKETNASPRAPAILSYGFRPFFFLAALWAGLAMIAWIGLLSGALTLPIMLDPVSWHAKAFLFGYLSAVLAGFLLTAVPNWTGGAPLKGWPLLGLVLLWLAGRVTDLYTADLPAVVVAFVDVSFPLILGAVILREVIARRNWRNLVVLVLLGLHTLALLLVHLETAGGGYPAQGLGMRLGLATVIGMICLIGGRIIPSFTGNWLLKMGVDARPASPMQRLDKFVFAISLPALCIWVAAPDHIAAAVALTIFAMGHLLRLARWQGHRTAAEPLLAVLHLAYAMVPCGAVLMAISKIPHVPLDTAAAQHLWMAGAIGMMTLAVMIRATLGHTGRRLVAGPGAKLILLAVLVASVIRIVAGIGVGSAGWLYHLSAAAWCTAFFGYALVYGAALFSAKRAAVQA
ncbi:NnrS family protein [Phaeobacter inhibens]|uniref:NnrS family protein n=1 Tax=Phaeobacter inhibens TaxID=221822 RepID=UPI0021A41079|nr:NnrS family protein [Phaeobacter inhibens]UWR62603.1 NnrS family protein [Phaeobacter inhibens]